MPESPRDRAPRIVTLGEIVVEIMAAERGQSLAEPGALTGPYPSGAPAIFIDQVARIGIDCALIACVGDDDFGMLNRRRLAADGVDIRHIRVLADETTGTAFVTYRRDGERDFIYHIRRAACARIEPDQINADVLAGCTLIHIMGTSLFSPNLIQAAQKAVKLVKNAGGRVSFDPNIRKEMLDLPKVRAALRAILGQTDILIPSDGELTQLTRADDEAGAVAEILAMGVREIVIKKAARGCRYYDTDTTFDVPAFAVTEIDPTGAGDCFGATYVALRENGWTMRDALRYANAAGACAVSRQGPMEGTATIAELEAFMARHGGAGTAENDPTAKHG